MRRSSALQPEEENTRKFAQKSSCAVISLRPTLTSYVVLSAYLLQKDLHDEGCRSTWTGHWPEEAKAVATEDAAEGRTLLLIWQKVRQSRCLAR